MKRGDLRNSSGRSGFEASQGGIEGGKVGHQCVSFFVWKVVEKALKRGSEPAEPLIETADVLGDGHLRIVDRVRDVFNGATTSAPNVRLAHAASISGTSRKAHLLTQRQGPAAASSQ